MSVSTIRTLAALAVSGIAVAGTCWTALRLQSPPPAKPATATEEPGDLKPIPVRPDTEPYEPYKFLYSTEQSIQVYKDRVKRDPQDHASLTTLGTLHLRRAKEIGNHAAYDDADRTFAAALNLLPSYDPARIGKAAVANAKHQFLEGRSIAEAVYKSNPEGPNALEALVLTADADLELGRYEETEKTLQELVKRGGQPTPSAFLARLGRMAELRGNIDAALDLLNRAAAGERNDAASKADLAWYAFRAGEIQLSQGRVAEAAALLETAIRDNPASPEPKVGLARVRLTQGRAKEAVQILDDLLKVDRELEAFLEKVRAANGTPAAANPTLETTLTGHQNIDTLLLLGDALVASGAPEQAEKLYQAAYQKSDKQTPASVRELILHSCDTNRRLPQALELAEREIKIRRDVFSCDSLAWALFKNDKLPEAEKAATDAMRLGTRDAVILFHAGAIAHKQGKTPRAKELLEKALAVNPHFSGTHVAEAKRLLAK